MFKPALNITEQIADFLSEKIITGEMVGGDRIQEVKLATTLSVSRGSVREALLILERRHLITVVPRRGAQVNSLTLSDAREVTHLLSMLDDRYFFQALSPGASLSRCEEFKPVLAGMHEAAKSGDILAALKLRAEFYELMLAASSLHARALFEALLPSSQRIHYQLLSNTELDLYDLARYYQALVVAIQQRCSDRVSELICAAARRVESLCDGQFQKVAPISAQPLANLAG